jgi:hypothetical protein
MPFPPSEPEVRAPDFAVRPLQEPLEHPKLVEDFHRRRVDGVAAKVAEEIGMLFEYLHPAPGPGEQQAGHHSRRSAADDDQVQLGHAKRSKRSEPTRARTRTGADQSNLAKLPSDVMASRLWQTISYFGSGSSAA